HDLAAILPAALGSSRAGVRRFRVRQARDSASSQAVLFDISIPVAPGTPEWPGDTPYSCGWSSSLAAGATVNLSTITTSPHVGTHADAPLHVRDGAVGIEALPLELFAGPALVLGIEGDVRDVMIDELTARFPTPTSGAADVPERL